MSKLCPKIILEGTRLTYKTEIAFALNEHPQIAAFRDSPGFLHTNSRILRCGQS